MKKSDRLRETENPTVFGYKLDRETLTPKRQYVVPMKPGQDHGCDPLGDGKYRMVPSGDIVSWWEMRTRLGHPVCVGGQDHEVTK